MSDVLLKMALDAIADESMLPVLGDFIQELGWYDERVVTVCIMPLGKAPYRMTPRQLRARRAIVSRTKLEGPNVFHRLTAKPTSALARAVASVVLFSEWPKRPFGSLHRVWMDRNEYRRRLWAERLEQDYRAIEEDFVP